MNDGDRLEIKGGIMQCPCLVKLIKVMLLPSCEHEVISVHERADMVS